MTKFIVNRTDAQKTGINRSFAFAFAFAMLHFCAHFLFENLEKILKGRMHSS